MSWGWHYRRLSRSLRLLARGVQALERLAEATARSADALEAWTATAPDAAEEIVVPSLPEVLARHTTDGRTFRTAPRGSAPPTGPDPVVGGITYRDPQVLAEAWQAEQTLTAALGRPPSEQELADALAVEDRR